MYLNKLILVFVFACSIITAQEGHVYTTTLDFDEVIADARPQAIVFDDRSFMLLANNKGISLFNGETWTPIKNVPANVLSLQCDDSSKKVFVGLNNEFGYLERNTSGTYIYTSIKNSEDVHGSFSEIKLLDEQVVFYSNEAIYFAQRNNFDSVQLISSDGYGAFHGFFTHKNSLFVQIAGKGIHKYRNGKLVSIRDRLVKGHEKILFSAYFNLKNTVVGTSDNKIYLFNGRGFVQFAKYTEIRDFLEENILWDGINLSGSYFAVTTLTGGCAVIDKMYGKNVFTINYQTGLPDDEIYTISKDNQGGVWLSHEHGISRFDLKIPFRSYSTYPGIDATINSVVFYDNQLYVAANDGVYKLKKIENYKEIEVLVKKKKQIPVKKSRRTYKKTSRKSNTKKEEDNSPKYEYVAQKQYAMQSIKHRFVPIENVHGKCKEVFEEDGRLFALSNYGLFEIRDTIGIPLVSDTYVSDVCKDRDSTILYIATLNGIYVMPYSYTEHGEVITEEYRPLFTNVTQPVHSLTQDSSRTIFFGMDGKAFMCKNDSLLVYQKPEELLFPRKVYEPVTVRLINEKVHFVQSFGVFVYDSYSNDLKYTDIDFITLDNIRFTTNKNSNWVFYNNEWVSVDGGRSISGKSYLNLFPKIKNIYTDEKDNIWLIDNSENLIKILADHESDPDTTLSTIICSVSDNNDSLYALQNPVFSYANNVVKLNLTAPFYLSNEGIEFSYYVEGLKNYERWSGWSSHGHIELSSVPAGKYKLKVRARNILGQISDENVLHFEVLKPFWQKREFHIAVVVLFLVLVGLVFYWSNRALIKKKNILEQKVRERTQELQLQKDKTEELLLNILPKETAEELKLNNRVKPRDYDNVTVMFTDFKGFTKIAEELTPAELVDEIDYCFKAFDNIISKYKIEKIKTIGDSYMCAGGLPTKFKNNAIHIVKAALEMRDFIKNYEEERKRQNLFFFQIRLGIHTGKVVAGVVGTKKYAYDIWGDTVNVASRMESSGEPGKINISGDTYEIIKEKFDCSYRGKVNAKSLGEVEMYFVDDVTRNGSERKTKSKKKTS